MSALNSVIGRGVLASRPAAGTAGALYYATDDAGGRMYRDNGSSWDLVADGSMFKIGEYVADGTTGTATFSSIPSTFRHLRVIASGRGTSSAAQTVITGKINSDIGSNYDTQQMYGNGTTNVAAQTVAGTGFTIVFPAATSPTAISGSAELSIPNYADTNLHKSIIITMADKRDNTGTNWFSVFKAIWYRSTSAISRLDFTTDAGNFATGSYIQLYGIL